MGLRQGYQELEQHEIIGKTVRPTHSQTHKIFKVVQTVHRITHLQHKQGQIYRHTQDKSLYLISDESEYFEIRCPSPGPIDMNDYP